jgi:type IV pilus assembly protein PilM
MVGRRSAWGIDVGESTIRAVKLTAEKGQARIVALDVVQRPRSTQPGGYVDRDEQLRAALTQFLSRNSLGRDTVAICPPGAGFDRFIQLPPVEKRRIPQIVVFEAKQQIPFPLDQVVWDYQPVTEKPIPGQEIEVGLFAFRSELVNTFLANLNQCGMGADLIGMGRLALYNFITYDRHPGAGTMLIDFGASSTDVIIFNETNFRVRSIPFAGDTVTKALQNKFGISFEEAEDLKRKAGQSKQVEKLLAVMRPAIEKIVGQVTQTVGFFRSQFRELKIEQCLLVGDGFKLVGAEELFKQALDCPVQKLTDLQTVALGEEVLTSPYRNELSSFATAIGLALQAVGLGPVKINLLPREMITRREVSRKKPSAVVALIAIAATLGVLYSAQARDAKSWPRLLSDLSGKISSMRSNMNTRSQIENVSDVAKRRDATAKMSDGRLVVLDTLNALAAIFDGVERDPRGIYLNKLTSRMLEKEIAAGRLGDKAADKLAEKIAEKALGTDIMPVVREGAVMRFVLSGETEHEPAHDYILKTLLEPIKKLYPAADIARFKVRAETSGGGPAVPPPGPGEAPAPAPAPGPGAQPPPTISVTEFDIMWDVPLVPVEAGAAGKPGPGTGASR